MPDGNSVRPSCPVTNYTASDGGTLCVQASETPTPVGYDVLFSQGTAVCFPTPLTVAASGAGTTPASLASTGPGPSNVMQPPPAVEPSGFSVSKFVAWLDEHATPKSGGACAMHVRMGLEAGGMDTDGRPKNAKDYGSFLARKGCALVSPTPNVDYAPNVGDIMVIQPPSTSENQAGHIQAWGGKYWISDFKQTGASAPWPGKGYADEEPAFEVYRCR
jgi:hypothetical protein